MRCCLPLAKLAESRDGETAGHLRRLQQYTRTLAQQAARESPWEGWVDATFLDQLQRCVPLHDIGKLGLPEAVLLKPGRLDAAERAVMETHPVLGDQLLEALGNAYGEGLDFLRVAREVVRHHHERYDGLGYPDGLVGEDIQAVARLVAVADVYDALRRERSYKAAVPHAVAVQVMLEESAGQFDPVLLQAFAACAGDFERIYRELPD